MRRARRVRKHLFPRASVHGQVRPHGMTRPFDRVTAHEITKVFGPTRALAGVSLQLDAGAVTSIEGPNGAGKSTLLAILATLSRATSGTVRYGDLDAREDLDLIRPAIGL